MKRHTFVGMLQLILSMVVAMLLNKFRLILFFYILHVFFLYCFMFSYREIWEIQKDAFIRRYQRLNPQVSSFDADIAR